MELVNAVGGGDIDRELDLDSVYNDIDAYKKQYEPEYHPALKLRFTAEGSTVLLFGSGTYNIAGAGSLKELDSTNQQIIHKINNLISIDTKAATSTFEVRNLVYLDEFDRELDLYNLCNELDAQKTRYEPEVMSCIYYSPTPDSGTFMIFRTGKILHTGLSEPESIKKLFTELFEFLNEIFQN